MRYQFPTIGLLLLLGCQSSDQIVIVNDPIPGYGDPVEIPIPGTKGRNAPRSISRTELARKFASTHCPSRKVRHSIREIISSDAKKIRIHGYDARSWKDFGTVKLYVNSALSAVPENGSMEENAYWAEMSSADIFASIEFANGKRGRMDLSYGYAHVQDSLGCEWWGRYLGPNRSKWITKP